MGLVHYLREAWRIVFWNDEAIRRVMNVSSSLYYGTLFWALANIVPDLIIGHFGPMKEASLPLGTQNFSAQVLANSSSC